MLFYLRCRRALLFLILLPIFCSGCGKGKEYSLAPVSGTITQNGEPLIDATVTFTPTNVGSSIAPASFGRTDAFGKYVLEVITSGESGAMVAEHKVAITVFDDEESMSAEDSDAGMQLTEGAARRIPLRYNRETELRFNVTDEGSSSADFKLESD